MPDAQRVAIGKPDGSIQVWPVTIASVEPLLQLHSATPGLRSLNASANSRYLASLDEDGVALVWDLQIGQQMARVPAQPSCTEALVSPAGDRLVTLGREPTIAVWEIPSGKLMQSWDGPAQPLRAMQTRQDGWVVADQTLQQIFRIDLAQLEHAPQPLGATSRLHGGACVLSPQGDRLAVVGNWYYEAVAVRPVSDPAKTTFLGGHLSGALQAQWLDETRLVTAGFDGTLRIWNADSRQQLAVLSVDQLELRGFVIAADQSQLVSWHANPGERSSFVTWDLTTILGTEPSSP
jgi:WD40 repeat protein